MTTDESIERRARAFVVARTVFKAVMVMWVISVIGMITIWTVTTPDGYFWPIWPILGMGVAAIIWGLAIYQRFPFRIRQDQVEREMERLRRAE